MRRKKQLSREARVALARNLDWLMRQREPRWTQAALAEKTGLGQRTISNALNEDGPDPEYPTIEALGDFFGVKQSILHERMIEEYEILKDADRLREYYAKADPESRKTIMRVAENLAERYES